MKALVVVDMQEDYIGEDAKYNFGDKETLISNINQRIKSYLELHNYVIYVKNKRKDSSSNLVTGLNSVTDFLFEKETSSCFSSIQFKNFLEKNKIDELEICGIDGNCCVKSTAIDAAKNGYKVSILLSNVGVINKDRFKKTLSILEKNEIELKY